MRHIRLNRSNCFNVRIGTEYRRSILLVFRTTDAVLEYLRQQAIKNGTTVSNEIHMLCEKARRKAAKRHDA
jgi:macrodomain Ter protein organizer (MatP/YcbG family)